MEHQGSKIVYVVTSGCYSDYMVNTVFDNKELAEEYIRQKNGGDEEEDGYGYRIEEFGINTGYFDLPKGYLAYQVTMDKEGNSKIKTIHSNSDTSGKNDRFNYENIYKKENDFIIINKLESDS